MPDSKNSTPGCSEHPRHRLLLRGPRSLSDAELLTVLLRSSGQVAENLLAELGGLENLANADGSLQHVGPCTETRAATLLAAVELSCRLIRARIPERQWLARVETVASYLQLRYGQPDQEVMGALYLDCRRRLVHETEIFRGTLGRAAVEPRSILRVGLQHHACWLVLFHTHPSGDPAPSAEDLAFTRRMEKAAEIVGIGFVDHLILGYERWVSLKRSAQRGR